MSDYFLNEAFEPQWPDRQWQRTKQADNFGFSFHGEGRLAMTAGLEGSPTGRLGRRNVWVTRRSFRPPTTSKVSATAPGTC